MCNKQKHVLKSRKTYAEWTKTYWTKYLKNKMKDNRDNQKREPPPYPQLLRNVRRRMIKIPNLVHSNRSEIEIPNLLNPEI